MKYEYVRVALTTDRISVLPKIDTNKCSCGTSSCDILFLLIRLFRLWAVLHHFNNNSNNTSRVWYILAGIRLVSKKKITKRNFVSNQMMRDYTIDANAQCACKRKRNNTNKISDLKWIEKRMWRHQCWTMRAHFVCGRASFHMVAIRMNWKTLKRKYFIWRSRRHKKTSVAELKGGDDDRWATDEESKRAHKNKTNFILRKSFDKNSTLQHPLHLLSYYFFHFYSCFYYNFVVVTHIFCAGAHDWRVHDNHEKYLHMAMPLQTLVSHFGNLHAPYNCSLSLIRSQL